MLIREIFAGNLRRLCETRGSINFVCRQLGIHRQQFALYLRAERLPNKKTMQRLSRYFKVPEEAFFVDPSATRTPVIVDECDIVLARVKESPPSLPQGIYQTYFWAPSLEDSIIGALTVVKAKDNGLTFRRLTATAERVDPTWSYVKGDHQGVVTERMGWIYFMGSNGIEPKEPTLLAVKWAALSEPLLSGHGMVISHLGPTMVNVVLAPLDRSLTLLSAIRGAKALSMKDPKLALVSRFLRKPIVY